jgi:hypothetical protein
MLSKNRKPINIIFNLIKFIKPQRVDHNIFLTGVAKVQMISRPLPLLGFQIMLDV